LQEKMPWSSCDGEVSARLLPPVSSPSWLSISRPAIAWPSPLTFNKLQLDEMVVFRVSWGVDFLLDDRSAGRKLLNLLENRSDPRRRADHQSSKRVHDGEPISFSA
jgi:hypothetical protein